MRLSRAAKLMGKRLRLRPQPSVHWRLLTLELLLMRLERPTRRDLGELVSVLAIAEDVWNEDIEVIFRRASREPGSNSPG